MHKHFAAFLLSFSLAAGAHSAVKELKPGWNLFTPEQDVQLGREASAEILKQKQLVHDPKLEAYVTRIGSMLMRSPHAGTWPYEFHIVNDKNVNAFALPGGFVYVNTGAIDACENEAQLAGVMAHEMSHVALRHGTHQMTSAAPVQIAAALAGAVFGRSVLGQLTRAGIGLAAGSVLLRFSRGAEAQADYNGVEIMADAGYNPLELAHFFEKLESKSSSSRLAEFLSDHPNPGNRVQAISEEVQQLPRKQYATSITGDFPAMKDRALHIPPPRNLRSQFSDQHSTGAPPARPSSEMKEFRGQSFSIQYPANWQVFGDQQSRIITIAPPEGIVETADGGTAVGYGMEASYYQPQPNGVDLDRDTQALINQLASSNPGLRASPSESVDVAGGRGLVTTLRNRSPFENETEVDLLVTAARPGGLFYIIFIAPQSEFDQVRAVFDRMRQSLRFS